MCAAGLDGSGGSRDCREVTDCPADECPRFIGFADEGGVSLEMGRGGTGSKFCSVGDRQESASSIHARIYAVLALTSKPWLLSLFLREEPKLFLLPPPKVLLEKDALLLTLRSDSVLFLPALRSNDARPPANPPDDPPPPLMEPSTELPPSKRLPLVASGLLGAWPMEAIPRARARRGYCEVQGGMCGGYWMLWMTMMVMVRW